MANFLNRLIDSLGYVQKSEDSKGTDSGPESFAFDPSLTMYRTASGVSQKGLKKPGYVPFDVLRRMSKASEVARLCINTLKHEITQTKWAIVPIDPKNAIKDDKRIKEVEHFFKFPNQLDTWRTFNDKVLEDLLVLDACAIELNKNRGGGLNAMYYVDGATIRPCFDEHGVLGDPAYVQVLPTSVGEDVKAEFARDELVYFMQNPQADVRNFGYGLSPLEGVILSVSNMINAANYNGLFFQRGTIPQLMMYLGDANKDQVEHFKAYWQSQVEGKPWSTTFFGGKEKPDIIKMSENNRDMQFMEYQNWLLRLIVAAFEMSPQDIGFTMDINKAVGEVQAQLSKSQGFRSILNLLKEIYSIRIINQGFGYDDLMFQYMDLEPEKPMERAQIADIEVKTGLRTRNEYRKEVGLDPLPEGDKAFVLTGAGIQYVDDPMEMAMQEQPIAEKSLKHDVEMVNKTVTAGDYLCWMDDRGYSQPFICTDEFMQAGYVIKPPIAVDIDGPYREERLSTEALTLGLNVPWVKMTAKNKLDEYFASPLVAAEFQKYITLAPEYYSKKWEKNFGKSRDFQFYLVQDYINGVPLCDETLLSTMARNPEQYRIAVKDLARLWQWEKDKMLGDRRANQYLMTQDGRAYGVDYQFEGDKYFYDKTKTAVYELLYSTLPLLAEWYVEDIGKGWDEKQ